MAKIHYRLIRLLQMTGLILEKLYEKMPLMVQIPYNEIPLSVTNKSKATKVKPMVGSAVEENASVY